MIKMVHKFGLRAKTSENIIFFRFMCEKTHRNNNSTIIGFLASDLGQFSLKCVEKILIHTKTTTI